MRTSLVLGSRSRKLWFTNVRTDVSPPGDASPLKTSEQLKCTQVSTTSRDDSFFTVMTSSGPFVVEQVSGGLAEVASNAVHSLVSTYRHVPSKQPAGGAHGPLKKYSNV